MVERMEEREENNADIFTLYSVKEEITSAHSTSVLFYLFHQLTDSTTLTDRMRVQHQTH